MLIDLEGIDGCGKSTQCKLLKEKLESIGKNVLILKEPTNEPHGQKLWDVLHGKRKATNEEILEFFILDRKQHVEEKIQPALDQGTVVIMDRYYYSSMAYQVAGGLDVDYIRNKHDFAPTPDIVLIFDLPVSTYLSSGEYLGGSGRVSQRIHLSILHNFWIVHSSVRHRYALHGRWFFY